jgi:hypothetical protein
MKKRLLGVGMLALGSAAMAWLLPAPAAGQAATKAAPAKGKYKAPRADDGKTANLQGIWIVDGWDTSRYSLEWHNGATGIRPGRGAITDPANGLIPYKPEARQKQQENFKNRFQADPVNHCYMTGVPRFVTSGYPFQILQTPKYIMLASEYTHMLRYVYMDRKVHQYDGSLDFWLGDSIGRWDGDTLVVSTTANNAQTWYDMSGNHHSDKLTVEERFTRTGADTMAYTATMTDPETLTRPFTVSLTLHRNTDQYAQLMEYECHAYAEEDVR